MKRTQKAFTVLEFLVVIAIMGILISIVLVGLSAARERSRDDRRIARMQTISVALEDFASDCRAYPLRLDPTYECPSNTALTFGNYISGLPEDLINDSTVPGRIHYQPLSFSTNNGTGCTGYHLYVQLEQLGNQTAMRDSNFDSTQFQVCNADTAGITDTGNPSPSPINGATDGVYDLRR
jgi:prepilin-type N-terminal cleavage/methylation domain-containing protein